MCTIYQAYSVTIKNVFIHSFLQLDSEDVLAIWGMLIYHGARCQSDLDETVTHLITSSTSSVSGLITSFLSASIHLLNMNMLSSSGQIKKELVLILLMRFL